MKNPDMGYYGMVEALGETVLTKLQRQFWPLFYQVGSGFKYKVNYKSLFGVLDKLCIDDQFIIVAFDVYLDYYLTETSGLTKNNGKYLYKGVEIISISSGTFSPLLQAVFVIRKRDAPFIEYCSPSNEQVTKYILRQIDDCHSLYSSIIKLSFEDKLMEETKLKFPNDNIKEKSLFSAFLTAEVKWSKTIPIIGIKLMYDLRDNGSSIDINSISSFTDFASKNRFEARRSEQLAMYELGKELNLNFIPLKNSKYDAAAEKDGEKYYLEVKYYNSGINNFVYKLNRWFRYDIAMNHTEKIYIAVVSENPINSEKRELLTKKILNMNSFLNVRFYSLYRE